MFTESMVVYIYQL